MPRHGRQRRLRQLDRRRPELPAARQPAHPGQRRTCAGSRRSCPALSPNTNAHPPGGQPGRSEYNALILGVRRRLSHGLRLHRVLHAVERQEHDRHRGRRAEHRRTSRIRTTRSTIRVSSARTSTTDARHRVTAQRHRCRRRAAFRVAPFFLLPLGAAGAPDRRPRPEPGRRHHRHPDDGLSRRRDTTLEPQHRRRVKAIGDCKTVNCGRGAVQSQINLRVSKSSGSAGARTSRRSARCSTCSTPEPERLPDARQSCRRPARRTRRCCSRRLSPATSSAPNSASASSVSGSRSRGQTGGIGGKGERGGRESSRPILAARGAPRGPERTAPR